ncbi:MAG: NAD(P)-dependent glycerol-3-phosphate dehydrogenase [Burkholderiales bacterium]|nr:NAD(P)-dependent glycerol-3-phosphate dehydrogenase [Burkholderiales bacterium]
MRLAIFGAGAWGAALAVALGETHDVRLWDRDAARAAEIAARRRTRYLPDVVLPDAVRPTGDFTAALDGAELAIVATPTAGARTALERMRDAGARVPVVFACKGFERSSGKLAHEIAAEVLGGDAPAGVLSGPSYALEVARGLPTAVTLAAADVDFARTTARALHRRRLRIYYSDDVVGVAVGGAVKNVMAIATGISDALGLGLNARAALVTRGLAEVTRLGVRLGGRAETFMGLAGAGDLILTCTGDLSRNRRVGLALGRGEALEAILAGLGHVAEGVHTAREVEARALAAGVDMPINRAVCEVLFQGVAPRDAVEQLLARDPKGEGAPADF